MPRNDGRQAEFSSRSNGIWDGTRLDAQYWMVEVSHGLRLRLLCADVQNQSFFTGRELKEVIEQKKVAVNSERYDEVEISVAGIDVDVAG